MRVSALKRNPLNYRVHSPEQKAAMRQMLNTVGWVAMPMFNQRTDRLVDGHLRLELAEERGEPTLQTVIVDLSEEEERLVLASYDPLSAMATVDTSNLGTLLAGLSLGDDALSTMLTELGKRNGVIEVPEPEVKEAPARDVQWMVLVECANEGEQTLLLERFAEEGLNVRALIG